MDARKRNLTNTGGKLESEIKLAWKQGFKQALVLFSSLEESKFDDLAEEAWSEQRVTIQTWNDNRIAHREGRD